MPALNLDTDAERIAERIGEPDTLFVACLCAEWCGTCREYREGFDRLADAHPDICFAWIDIENQADRFDDLDVENFPTILIEDAVTTRFFGTVLPQASIVGADAGRPDRAAGHRRRAETAARARRRLDRRSRANGLLRGSRNAPRALIRQAAFI